MQKRKSTICKVSFLVVVMLTIMAFTRGAVSDWLMIMTVSLWIILSFGIRILRGLVCCTRFLKKYVKQATSEFKHKIFDEVPASKPKKIYNIDLAEEPETLAMHYVNHLITIQLQSAYPKATWDWISKNPFLLVKSCGSGKISTKGTGEYHFAEVTFDKTGGIQVDLFRYAPKKSRTVAENAAVSEYDPEAWYTLKGQNALADIIKELRSKGYSSFILKKDGLVYTCDEEKQMKNESFQLQDFPEQMYWKKLAALVSDGTMKAKAFKDYFLVEW